MMGSDLSIDGGSKFMVLAKLPDDCVSILTFDFVRRSLSVPALPPVGALSKMCILSLLKNYIVVV